MGRWRDRLWPQAQDDWSVQDAWSPQELKEAGRTLPRAWFLLCEWPSWSCFV